MYSYKMLWELQRLTKIHVQQNITTMTTAKSLDPGPISRLCIFAGLYLLTKSFHE